MPFHDTPDGQTHSYNDGCGEPEHNQTPEQVKQEILEEFIENGAEIEHRRWSNWQKYLHSLCTKNDDGTLTIPAWQVERAERQIATDYLDLTEKEKESDRKEVRTYIPILSTALDRMADITKNNTMREERQFILNVLNGIDSVDGPQATSAIRKMLDARYVGK